MHEGFIQVLEATMLLCFGISWPIDIVHTLRVKHASKKSYMFLGLIITGYLAGLAAKCVRSSLANQPLEPVTWLYVANVVFLVVDLAISFYYQTISAANGALVGFDEAEEGA